MHESCLTYMSHVSHEESGFYIKGWNLQGTPPPSCKRVVVQRNRERRREKRKKRVRECEREELESLPVRWSL